MTEIFDAPLLLSQLTLPPQDIKVLSFCAGAKTAKVAEWTSNLRLTQARQTSVELYDALPELSHLKTDPKTRFDMLEVMWPAVHHCSQVLSKEFLQQPLLLPAQAQKTAIIAQAMQKHLLDGYLVCIRDLILQKKLKSAQLPLLKNCLYRSASRVGQIMLRCYQLYTAPPPMMWRILHLLYQIAEEKDALFEPVDVALEDKSGCRTVSEAYVRPCALASLRPNQLSQNDITLAYNTLERWSKSIKIKPAKLAQCNSLYLINLNGEAGPTTKNRFKAGDFDRILEFKVEGLAEQIKQHLYSGGKSADMGTTAISAAGLNVPPAMTNMLLEHLIRCWTADQPRGQMRKRSDIAAEAAFGLTDAHFQICGALNFDTFTDGNTKNESPGNEADDLLASLSGGAPKKSPKNGASTKVIDINIRNVSDGGYCVTWESNNTGRIESGEIICIRENASSSWGLGVVRWIRQLKNKTQAGVQLITNQPIAYAAAMIYDMGGETDYMRAIHVPSPSSADLTAGILTSTAPFKEQTRVKLKQKDKQIKIRLNKCEMSTSKVKLFSFITEN